MRFYERLEIKDLICYFRILINPNDDLSFKRIINRPKRSIGEKALQNLEDYAQKEKFHSLKHCAKAMAVWEFFLLKKHKMRQKNSYKIFTNLENILI